MTPDDAIRAAAARLAAAGDSRPRAARDPVNLPMIRNWLEALGGPGGDPDPDTAPPAMIQVWTMPGLHGVRGDDDPLGLMSAVLDQAGYTSVVATNCDQTYHRYLKLGEQLSVRARLLDVAGPKRTALGEGWFVTTRSTWFSSGEPVATMDFRILKFRPPDSAAPAATTSLPQRRARDDMVATTTSLPEPVMRPQVTPDTAFFWAGTAIGELRIQRCAACGALRHPPGPMCPACGIPSDGSYLVAAGTGEVFSYVVHHHPPVPGKKLPLVVALVQLPEGVRMVGEMPGVRPDQVRIGLPVRATFVQVDDDLNPFTLPAWRLTEGTLPDRVIDVTPTFVISSALATRDFQDVHHDRDRAVGRGAKDIFLNILTTTGLVQRYVCDWAPDAVVRAISIRLGVPCHAGDTLTLTGQVTASEGTGQVVSVTGSCRLGDHVTGTVRITRC
ncbi:MAG TPA: OB-fold domain-containing protein [Streptosporangiaceae bacterium]|nr:OB-fold domain-containing protein [Streptosporangiaceae bacterium]